MSQASPDSDESQEQASAPPADGSGGSLVVVDPDSGARNLAEDLEDDLDRPVVAIDSMDFEPETSEEVMAAQVFVVCWDLEIRSGADLIELIRRSPQLGDRVIIAACPAPTKEMVRTALQVGADAVCFHPYDAEELAGCIENVIAVRSGAKAA